MSQHDKDGFDTNIGPGLGLPIFFGIMIILGFFGGLGALIFGFLGSIFG